MATKASTSYYLSLLLLLLLPICSYSLDKTKTTKVVTCNENAPFNCHDTSLFNRNSFDDEFIFGAATSSFQVEGVEGRAFNIWDTFTHRYPVKMDGENMYADLAVDSFHHYEEDAKMLKEMGLGAYRFSIAWSRVLPNGRRGYNDRDVNEDGINYYHNLIDALISRNIKPFVTLFHWDLPQTLQDEYGGFRNKQIVGDYVNFVDLCFDRFGHKVKHWITFNQPYTVSTKGYGDGSNAPGRSDKPGTDPYWTAYYQILAHVAAIERYKTRYQESQEGEIGITIISRWFKPYKGENNDDDVEASKRAIDFMLGWFMDPLTTYDYPQRMKDFVGDRLPAFSDAQKDKLSLWQCDFIGINYYYTQYAIDAPEIADPNNPSYKTDPQVIFTTVNPEGIPIGPEAATFAYYPKGLEELLVHIKEKYNNPKIYITENGFNDFSNIPIYNTILDHGRVDYHCSHLCFLQSAINNANCNVKGYFAWSLIDNYEFGEGYNMRFGMNYVDFNNVTTRGPKLSALWYKNFVEATPMKTKPNDHMTCLA